MLIASALLTHSTVMLRLCLVLLFTTVLAKEPLSVFVISDFSLAFVHSQFDRSLLPSGQFICPPSAYPDALSQFQFTSDVIAGVKSSIPMNIQYYAYSGGDGDKIGNIPISNQDNFTETSIPAYTKFCAEGPEENDFERFIKLTVTPSLKTELLILFTAAPQAQIDKALPILSSTVKQVIVLGLNGSDASKAYPKSAVTLANFAEPERVSCMVNELYETIHGKVSAVDAVAVCYPPKPQSTVQTAFTTGPQTTEMPHMRILFINDFTSDFIVDDYSRSKRDKNTSNTIKCPGNAHPEAAAEFDFTNAIVQMLPDDPPTEIYYYANNGDNHPIDPTAIDKDSFDRGTEFKDVVCNEDDPRPTDISSLFDTLREFGEDLDVVVLFSAVWLNTPMDDYDVPIVLVGLNGAEDFSDMSITIDDFSNEYVPMIACMIEAAYNGETNLIGPCGPTTAPPPRPPLSLLFVNDFTTDFVGDEAKMAKKATISKDAAIGKCPGGAYPAAGQEFNFTVDVVNGIRPDANLALMFSEYLGGPLFYVDYSVMERDDFGAQATNIFKEACMEYHYPSDLSALANSLRFVPADVLVLFSAVPLVQPLDLPNFQRVIVVSLNGPRESSAYPDSSISNDDFSRPQTVSCMIDKLWDNIDDASLSSCAN